MLQPAWPVQSHEPQKRPGLSIGSILLRQPLRCLPCVPAVPPPFFREVIFSSPFSHAVVFVAFAPFYLSLAPPCLLDSSSSRASTKMMPTSSRIVVASLALSGTAFAQCYYPNGKVAEPDFPCDVNAEVSVCCGGRGTQCMSNRLCQDPDGRVIRGSCTDKNWLSPECGLYCLGM